MGRLIERLKDPLRSGVYRAARADEVLSVTRGSGLRLERIALEGARDKQALLEAIARALEFPDWFGGNWDALEDCLTDLAWREAEGHVLLFEGAQQLSSDDFGVLIDVLSSSAQFWAGRGRPFFAVFVNGPESLPALMREEKM